MGLGSLQLPVAKSFAVSELGAGKQLSAGLVGFAARLRPMAL